MSDLGKDSIEVAHFMALFSRLKDWSDDDPDGLFDFAVGDESVKELCLKLFDAARVLTGSELGTSETFAAPVDPAFITAWREYDRHYRAVIHKVSTAELVCAVGIPEVRLVDPGAQAWEDCDWIAEGDAERIEEVFHFAQVNMDDERWADHAHEMNDIKAGISAWRDLHTNTKFDLHGILRRRRLIPFVLIPRNVASKYGNDDKLSMFKNLEEAHHAFVFGAPYSALALMRSTMEAVLRDHYRAEGKDLSERIRSARHRLPRDANEAALHRLRKLANAVLHLDPGRDEGLPKPDEARSEKEIVSLLLVLRALIENVT